MRRTIAIATAVAALAAPAAAQAHVTLQPKEVPAGGYARLDVRVPNESGDASTDKVEVKFPPGFADVSIEAVPGWTVKVGKRPLAKPITTDDGDKLTDEVDTVTWSGGKIGPGEFQDFGISVALPDKPGTALTFKALQTYDDGEVVRWIGPPDADKPAPQVELTAATDDHGAAAGGAADGGGNATDVKAAVAAAPANDDGGDGAPVWLAVLALVVGVLGLLAGVGGLMASRRRTA